MSGADGRRMRIRASGVVIRDGKILLIDYVDPAVGAHYNLPGGGLEVGERLRDAVMRELMEEAGVEVTPVDLLLVWEHMGEAGRGSMSVQTVGMMFLCEMADDQEPTMQIARDEWQVGIKWLPLEELANAPLLPPVGRELVAAIRGERPRLFLDEV